MFCPNCSAELVRPVQESCWNCGARFGPGASWAPVQHPLGPFRKFSSVEDRRRRSEELARQPIHPIGRVLIRLVVAVCAWLVLVALVIGSAIGRGSIAPLYLFVATVPAFLVWSLWPLLRLVVEIAWLKRLLALYASSRARPDVDRPSVLARMRPGKGFDEQV
jgi:hypothetical protein